MADVLFIEYPKCSTCKKAKAWLDAHGVAYADRHIVEDNPTSDELAAWHAKSGLPLRRFFNTSGMLYRERNVKALLDAGMSDADAYALLAENGMMVKRPLVVGDVASMEYAVKVVPPASLTVMDCAQGKLWRMWSRYVLTEGTSASFNPRSLMCATSCPM